MAKLGRIVVTMGQDLVPSVLFCEQRVIFSLIVCILDTVGGAEEIGAMLPPAEFSFIQGES